MCFILHANQRLETSEGAIFDGRDRVGIEGSAVGDGGTLSG